MNPQRTFAVVEKEFKLAFANWPAWGMIIVPTAALTGLLLYILHAIAKIHDGALPGWVMDYFLMFFVAMPALNAAKIAAAGIMGDKASRSLEPLLVTPLTPLEFIFSKLFIAVCPPVVFAIIAYEVFIRLAVKWNITTASLLGNIGGIACLGVVLAMTLLLTNLVALNGFLIAARKTETRSATLASTTAAEGILLLPVAGVYFGQRHHLSAASWELAAVGILLAANAVVFGAALARFRRETILFKWK